MATFLRDKQALKADVIAVQEPWNNQKNNTTHQPAGRTFQLVFPQYSAEEIPSVCLDSLVNRLIYNERGIEYQSDHYPIITKINISTP
ncbi:hypothetical protein N7540_011921 [Penicillium herquei]|nr:hypothetical protein N7540_011921 [Penicillium herquei]